MTESDLSAIRVIDFGQYLAGPLVGMLLADFGADVIRVDPPGGPRWDDPANAALHRNKRSVILDLKAAHDLKLARDLVMTADVVIEGFRPGVMARLGLSPSELCALNPRLIWCSIPGFGEDDPRAGIAGWEGVVSAAAGLYPQECNDRTGGPRFSAMPYASTMAALTAAQAIAAALVARERDGRGERIQVALYDAACDAVALGFENPPTIAFDNIMAIVAGGAVKNPAEAQEYRCRNGKLLYRDVPERGKHNFWDRFMPPGLKDDTSPEGEQRAAALLQELFLSKDAEEWEALAQGVRMACGTVQSTEQWLQDRHALDSETIVPLDDPLLGPVVVPGAALRISNCSWGVRHPRRLPGEDTEAVRAELAGTPKPQAPATAATGPAQARKLPLEGICALDFSNLLAGPGATRILGEYGAEVIKINKPALALGKIDPSSDEPTTFVVHKTTSAGKKTIFVDLKSAKGQEILKKLVERSDIIHHNFVPGLPERLGLGVDQLALVKANLIHSSVTCHGTGGWRETFRGHDHCAQATTGMMERFGTKEEPEHVGVLFNDYASSHISAFGIMIAIYRKLRSGKGAKVETALSRTATIGQIPFMTGYKGRVWNEPSGADAKGWGPLNRFYECADGALFLAAITERDIGALESVEEFGQLRGLTDEALGARLSRTFAADSVEHWTMRLQSHKVPVHAYCDLEAVLAAPLTRSRKLLVKVDHPGFGSGDVLGLTQRLASMPQMRRAPGAWPGLHTKAVLAELGYTSAEIKDLLAAEVIAGPMVDGHVLGIRVAS